MAVLLFLQHWQFELGCQPYRLASVSSDTNSSGYHCSHSDIYITLPERRSYKKQYQLFYACRVQQ